MTLTSNFCFYFRFIAQIVFSFIMSGVGVGLIFKDWENKGQAFIIGLMMVSNTGSAWFLNPKKPKTFEEKYKSMTDLLKQSGQSLKKVDIEDQSETEMEVTEVTEVTKVTEVTEKLVNSINPHISPLPPPLPSVPSSIPTPISSDTVTLPSLPSLPSLGEEQEIVQEINKVKEIGIEIAKLNGEL